MKYVTALAGLVLLAALIVPTETTVAQDTTALPEVAPHILRQPALSPDGKTLAFVHDGDIWVVNAEGGTARRLTVSVDNDADPLFSPDGMQIAFRSRRYGNDDVFVMPAEGGVAKRLTYSDAWDYPHAWLADSSGIVFSSYRKENGRDLYVVRTEGGEPWRITGGGLGMHEYHAQVSPDGKHIAYVNRGGDPARRRAYHGTANGEIWLCDFDGVTTSNHRRITSNRSHDAFPVWVGARELLWTTFEAPNGGSRHTATLSGAHIDEPSRRNWFKVGTDPKELTYAAGKVVFSSGNYGGWHLYSWDMKGKPRALDIRLNTDRRMPRARESNLTNAGEFALSPDGKKIAFIAGGDVFVMPAKPDAAAVQITDTVHEEKGIAWGPDSEKLVWVHGVTGQPTVYDLTLHFAGEPQPPEIQLYTNAAWPTVDKKGRVWAIVDEERIDAIRSVKDEPLAGIASIEGNFHGYAIGSPTWARFDVSPHGDWVLFQQPNENYDNRVVLGNTKTGKSALISHLFGSVSHVRFSADGKRVVFINNQEGDYDIWKIDLVPEEPRFKESEVEELFKKDDKPEKQDDDAGEEDDEESKEDSKEKESDEADKEQGLEIVFDGIKHRTERITSLDGHEFSPVALSDGKTYCFIGNVQGQANIWKLELDPFKGPNLNQLTRSRSSKSQLTLSPDEKTLWWLDGGTITSMSVKGGNTKSYSFRVVQRRKRDELRRAAFQEAVHVMDRYYYDREHHGLNWRETSTRYEQALNSIRTGDEYDALMDELLGELNSSHQGYTASDPRGPGVSDTTGYLGLIFDQRELSQGRYRVVEVLKKGPSDLAEGTPQPGEYLVSINGERLGGHKVIAQHLLNTVGKKTRLGLAGAHDQAQEREVAVKPVRRQETYSLWYDRWVEWQRDIVRRHSDGRLGYVHIQAMNDSSLRRFKQELGDDMLGKDGVVIDVRFNGGGRTAVDVLEILIKEPWLKRQRAGLDPVSENIYRSVALEKPSILLINEASFSNAEILAEGFRRLNIGQIVGVDTAGGVIGTGRYTLVDGSTMRLPSTGAFTVDMENLELKGREPDHYVENHPEELEQGIDRQTEKAVKELLKQLDNE